MTNRRRGAAGFLPALGTIGGFGGLLSLAMVLVGLDGDPVGFIVFADGTGFAQLGDLLLFCAKKEVGKKKGAPIARPSGALRFSKSNGNAAELACGSNSPR
ncbi:hypothetical protein NCG89_05080 [Spongiibacter taiwanensis]|uniref:hypothetical protein n=1 Tax=Spongiibacter taiwanensis TaxID=1748242 RepID=UPI00203551BE|nr:hypothetical protein [Spongiibacter taiwanensis]USA44158.1 hypothetical protein NCG89_05080 [Spongiibacter taiwanensis]